MRGLFLVSNAAPNLEAPFVSKAINWPLIYRAPTELQNLLLESGFEEGAKIVVGPLRIHTLAVTTKTAESQQIGNKGKNSQ